MPRQLVMDHTGHTTHEFNRDNDAEVKRAMERFDELVGKKGYVAARTVARGVHEKVEKFDPSDEEVIFHAPLRGG